MQRGMKARDWFLLGEKSITPILIKIIYYVSLILLIFGSCGSAYRFYLSYASVGSAVLAFFVSLIGGYIVVRLVAEFFLVIFQIKDLLIDIRNKD